MFIAPNTSFRRITTQNAPPPARKQYGWLRCATLMLYCELVALPFYSCTYVSYLHNAVFSYLYFPRFLYDTKSLCILSKFSNTLLKIPNLFAVKLREISFVCRILSTYPVSLLRFFIES